jgi:hypothetical protein
LQKGRVAEVVGKTWLNDKVEVGSQKPEGGETEVWDFRMLEKRLRQEEDLD